MITDDQKSILERVNFFCVFSFDLTLKSLTFITPSSTDMAHLGGTYPPFIDTLLPFWIVQTQVYRSAYSYRSWWYDISDLNIALPYPLNHSCGRLRPLGRLLWACYLFGSCAKHSASWFKMVQDLRFLQRQRWCRLKSWSSPGFFHHLLCIHGRGLAHFVGSDRNENVLLARGFA